MTAQRVQLQPAFVLHRRPYRETSWLLEVFTPEQGRVGLVARGARQARPRAGVLEPGRELLLSWSLRGELGQMTQAEAAGPVPALTGEGLMSVLYLNELLLRLTTRHDPHPTLFADYGRVLRELAQGPAAVPLRRFEKALLQELGYGLNLHHDLRGDVIRDDRRYDYRVGHGASPLPGPVEGIEIGGSTLRALREDCLDEAVARREVRRLLQSALQAHLGPRPLRTPDLFRGLRRLHAGRAARTVVTGEGA